MQLIHFVKSRALCKQCNKRTSLEVLDYHSGEHGMLFVKVLCPLCGAQYVDTVNFIKMWESAEGDGYLDLSAFKRCHKDSLSTEIL